MRQTITYSGTGSFHNRNNACVTAKFALRGKTGIDNVTITEQNGSAVITFDGDPFVVQSALATPRTTIYFVRVEPLAAPVEDVIATAKAALASIGPLHGIEVDHEVAGHALTFEYAGEPDARMIERSLNHAGLAMRAMDVL